MPTSHLGIYRPKKFSLIRLFFLSSFFIIPSLFHYFLDGGIHIVIE